MTIHLSEYEPTTLQAVELAIEHLRNTMHALTGSWNLQKMSPEGELRYAKALAFLDLAALEVKLAAAVSVERTGESQ